jgi:hypothetical protein
MAHMNSFPGMARRLLTGILLALCAVTALPQQPPSFYLVEIIVFRASGEAGALPDATPATAVSDDGIEATLVPTGKLNIAANRLRARTSGFRVLGHAAWTQAPTAYNSRRGVSAAQLGLTGSITGKVLLERNEKLHLGVDLTIEDGGRRYHLKELRKDIRRDQIHYFDNPSVGVLAIVTAAPTPTTAPAPAG